MDLLSPGHACQTTNRLSVHQIKLMDSDHYLPLIASAVSDIPHSILIQKGGNYWYATEFWKIN